MEPKNRDEILTTPEATKNTKDNHDTDMSGSESSTSNSDTTLRRALRKRGTESPFPENGEDFIILFK